MTKWIELALLAIRMIVRYGPRLWAIGKQIYDDIEGKDLPTTEAKALEFNKQAEMPFAEISGYVPRRPVLNEYRENVWRYRNPGKEPKRLMDARLRIKDRSLSA